MTGPADGNALLAAALELASHGVAVLRLYHPLPDGNCSCGSPAHRVTAETTSSSCGKHPNVGDGWQKQATTDPAAVRRWWADEPLSNVGIMLSPDVGLMGVDVDSAAGEAMLTALAAGDLPPTWEFTSGKGRRLLFRIPQGVRPKLVSLKDDGGDEALRFMCSANSQTVAPPSLHFSGVRYAWVGGRRPGELPLADMPEWMVGIVCPPESQPEQYESTASRAFTAGGDFNKRGSWDEMLEAHGFKFAARRERVRYFTRPGKAGGVSVSLGYYTAKDGTPALYVFSGSVVALTAGRSYDLFGAYTRLEHNGNWQAASQALESLGYGPPRPAGKGGAAGKPSPDEVFGASHTGGCGQPDDDLPPDFEFATNADFKSLNLSTDWVWKGWFQGGVVNLVASEAGMGKTRWIADLCRRVHHGLPWPDGQEMKRDDRKFLVMWVAADSQFAELVDLSEGFGFGDRICYSGSRKNPVGGISLDSADDFKSLYRRLKAARPLFLIVDTAGGATDANLSRQEEARRFFAPLSHIAVSLGICVIVVTHLNATSKVLGRRAEERVRCVIRMWAADKRPETPRRIEVMKSNHLFPDPIGMTLGSHGSDYTDSPPAAPEAASAGTDPLDRGPPTRVRECGEWLTEQVAERPQRVAKLIEEAEAAGFNRSTLYRTMRHLRLVETKDGHHHKWWGLPGGEDDDSGF